MGISGKDFFFPLIVARHRRKVFRLLISFFHLGSWLVEKMILEALQPSCGHEENVAPKQDGREQRQKEHAYSMVSLSH